MSDESAVSRGTARNCVPFFFSREKTDRSVSESVIVDATLWFDGIE